MRTKEGNHHSERRLGGLPPRYNFIMNPYPEFRFARCPNCRGKSGQRKVPLLVHVDPRQLVALNYTCRFCAACDLLIAHKMEIERLLWHLFAQRDPAAIGNDYLILGTVEKRAWRTGLTQRRSPAETLPHVHDFKTYHAELRMTQAGWYGRGQEPLVMEPPESREWVKFGAAC